jgi:MFS transporter, MHS family, shikimate and dehydroshikimate transport protein
MTNSAGERQSMQQVVVASLSGATLEWYDFNLYGLSAALVFNKLFFPTVSPMLGTLAALATFGVGFLLRPLGGLLFGHLGDRLGRKQMLVTTMLIIGGATFLIGLLPDYRTIGVWAPILLVLLRLFQGLGLGGEFGGASLLTVEHAPRERRGLWGGLAQTGPSIGYLLAVGATSLFAGMPQQQFLSWGWRAPFLFSAVLMVVGLLVRLKIVETPAFRQIRETGAAERIPVLAMLRRYPKTITLAFGARLGEAATSQIYQPFAITYLTKSLGLPNSVALIGVIGYNIVGLALIPLAGAISDRVGRKPLYLAGAIFVAVSAFPYFWALDTKSTAAAWTAMTLIGLGGAVCMSGLQATFLTELFGPSVRYSALSVAYQMSALVAGFIPAIATSMILAAGGASWPVATLVVGLGVISATCTLLLTETRHRDRAELETTPVPARV